MIKFKFPLVTMLMALPLLITLSGCSDEDEKSSAPLQQAAAVTCPFIQSYKHDCEALMDDNDNFLCVEGLVIGNPAKPQDELTIANPNGRQLSSILFSLDWGQFKTTQQSFKNCDLSCLNPVSPGRAFDEAATAFNLSPDALFDAIANELASVAVGTRTVISTPGKCK